MGYDTFLKGNVILLNMQQSVYRKAAYDYRPSLTVASAIIFIASYMLNSSDGHLKPNV